MLTIKAFEVNPLQENCYVVSDDTKECVIIDCGALYDNEQHAIQNYIREQQLKPVHHLCTHGHFDHVFGAAFVYKTFGLKPEAGFTAVPGHDGAFLALESGELALRDSFGKVLPLSIFVRLKR